MLPFSHSELAWRCSLTFLHVTAMSATVLRLVERRRSQLKWDDYFAAIALVLDCLFFSTLWIRTPAKGPYGDGGGTDSPDSQIFNAWMAIVVFPFFIWSTRISLSLAMARVVSPFSIAYKASIGSAYIFGVFCCVNVVHMSVVCADNTSWYQAPPYQCPIPLSLGLERLICDIISDLFIVAVPWFALAKVEISPACRRVVLVGFSASLLTATTSVVSAAVLMLEGDNTAVGTLGTMMGQLLGAVSLLACNLLVVVAFIYRAIRVFNPTVSEPQFDTTAARATPMLVTVVTMLPTPPLLSPQRQAGDCSIVLTELMESDMCMSDSWTDGSTPSGAINSDTGSNKNNPV